jgi:Retroviral aspartyl protease.
MVAHSSKINECEKHSKSEIHTVTMRVHLSKIQKLMLPIDTAAEISIFKGVSLRPGFDYEPSNGINVRGIANALLKTEGTVTLKLHMQMQDTTHTFHVMGASFDCQYNGIIGGDFWEDGHYQVLRP